VALTPAAGSSFARLLQAYSGLARDLVGNIPEADLRRAVAVIELIADRLDEVVRQGTAAFDADPARPPKDLRKKP
jgi:hypothetical protein